MASAKANRGTRSAVWRQGLLLLAGALVLIDLYMIFEYAPTERVMGIVQRLFYFHVPVVLTSFISFAVAAVGSAVYLTRRSRAWDRLAYASAEVGLVYFTIAIITGAVWAKPVWGAWWVWDANGTLTFVLWLIFIGYLMVRAYAPDADRGRRWSAVVGIIGAAAVPFVYKAADWWGGLHPERVTGPGAEGSLESAMLTTLLFSFAAFLVLYAALIAERTAQRKDEETIEDLRRAVGDPPSVIPTPSSVIPAKAGTSQPSSATPDPSSVIPAKAGTSQPSDRK